MRTKGEWVSASRLFQHAVSSYAGLTIAYWFCVLFGLSQGIGLTLAIGSAFTFAWISFRLQRQPDANGDLLAISAFALAFALGTSALYAFNPDDSTFFHRIAYLGLREELFRPRYETRLALDHIAPISAAHLMTSWEFFLVELGRLIGSEVSGYQIGGTFLSIALYTFAVNFVVAHFFPNSTAFSRLFAVCTVMLFLTFDAAENRRIGSWLFLGGWTGKCFFAAVLIALFPAADRAFRFGSLGDWFFAYCLIIMLLGLTGSALFTLPIAAAALILAYMALRRTWRLGARPLALILIPVAVGGLFILKFGNLRDETFWHVWEKLPYRDYVALALSGREMLLYLLLFPLILFRRTIFADHQALAAFALYQAILALIVLNPLLLPVFFKLVPSDGFWRTYYLFQYPTIVALVSVAFIELIQQRRQTYALLLGLALFLGISSGSSVFGLQNSWRYPAHFKPVFQEKLPESELHSVNEAKKACPGFRDFSIVLAPEPWEVTVQMIAPSLTSIAARNMHHNFLNTNNETISEPELGRIRARDFVSGHVQGNIDDFRHYAALSDIIAMRPMAVSAAAPYVVGFKEVSSNKNYVVFCREQVITGRTH